MIFKKENILQFSKQWEKSLKHDFVAWEHNEFNTKNGNNTWLYFNSLLE